MLQHSDIQQFNTHFQYQKTMVFFPFCSGFSILYLLGLSSSIHNNDPWETVFPDGDPWDKESSEEDSNITDVISLLGEGEVLITTHSPPNWSMIPINSETNEMTIEAVDQIWNEPMSTTETPHGLPVNQEPSELTQVFDEKALSRKYRSRYNEFTGRFVAVAKKSQRSKKVLEAFKNLEPVILKAMDLSQEHLELIFLQQKNHHAWNEIIDYPLTPYSKYWGQVCDYFWYKSDPTDKRFRGCFVSLIVQARTTVQVYFLHFDKKTKAQLLQCSCFYYTNEIGRPDSNETIFAVHKHADNEYFLLNNVPNSKIKFTLASLFTEVFLPAPIY